LGTIEADVWMITIKRRSNNNPLKPIYISGSRHD